MTLARFIPVIPFAMIFLPAVSSCGVSRQCAIPAKDSVRVEVRTIRETVHDTAYIELPRIMERVITKDTISTLENDYARSEAQISDGFLRHTLETKPAKHPVQIQKDIIYRDSVIFRDRVQTVQVPQPLTRWQSFKMRTGGAALTALILTIVSAALYYFFIFKHL
jgi:hypothetical protein